MEVPEDGVLKLVRKKLEESRGSDVSRQLVEALNETVLREHSIRRQEERETREDRARRKITETENDEVTQKLVANFNAAVIAERERNRKEQPVDRPKK